MTVPHQVALALNDYSRVRRPEQRQNSAAVITVRNRSRVCGKKGVSADSFHASAAARYET